MRIIGLVLVVALAACGPTSDVIRLRTFDAGSDLVVALDFAVGSDGSVSPQRGHKENNAVTVTFACSSKMPKRKAATISFDNIEIADHYFKPDRSADISPDAGNWTSIQNTYSLFGEVFEEDYSFMTTQSKEYNFEVIRNVIEQMRKTHSAKFGQLSPVKFADPDDLLGKLLSACWPTKPGNTGLVESQEVSGNVPVVGSPAPSGEPLATGAATESPTDPAAQATQTAQTESPPPIPSVIDRLDWARVPSREDFLRHYPDRASQLRLAGQATIECLVNRLGALDDCALISETPKDSGFGQAALRLSKLYKMKPNTKDGYPTAGWTVKFTIEFNMS